MYDSDGFAVGSEAGEIDTFTGIAELDRFIEELEAGPVRFPEDLDQLRAGLHLHAVTTTWDRGSMSGFDLVELLKAEARLVAHHQAEMLETIAEIAYRTDPEFGRVNEPVEFASSELRAGLKWTRRTAEWYLGLALELTQRLPRVLEMLREGRIDLPRAEILSEETTGLGGELLDQVLDQILPVAPELSTGQLRAAVKRVVMQLAPEVVKQQYESGWEDRRLVNDANPDHTANLKGQSLDPVQARKAYRRIHRIAQKLKKAGDHRTMDQIRADLFIDLLNGKKHPHAKNSHDDGSVEIRVDLTTLAELDDHPGDLAGYGPVLAEISRETVKAMEKAEWQVTVTDPETGFPIHTGVLKRRPSKSEVRRIRARDVTCVMPTCRIPAIDCDIDHRIPYAQGGPTHPDWNQPLCRWDHRGKDEGGWKITYDPQTGIYTFTSPLGHTYQTRPHKPP